MILNFIQISPIIRSYLIVFLKKYLTIIFSISQDIHTFRVLQFFFICNNSIKQTKSYFNIINKFTMHSVFLKIFKIM